MVGRTHFVEFPKGSDIKVVHNIIELGKDDFYLETAPNGKPVLVQYRIVKVDRYISISGLLVIKYYVIEVTKPIEQEKFL